MKEETKANAAEAGSETPTTKDANFDVLLAERAKREQNIKLYKEYRHPKDVTTLSITMKPTEASTKKHEVDDELAKQLHHMDTPPRERYSSPLTSSMEYGWIVPEAMAGENRRFARKCSDITNNPANYARRSDKSSEKEKEKATKA